MERQLGDLPPGFDTEPLDEIVGTGGPLLNQVAKKIARPNRIVFVNTGYTIDVESVQVLPANANRTYLLVQNRSSGSVFMSFGNKSNTYDGIEIVSGGNYEPYVYPFSSVHIIASLASSDVVIIEGYGR